MAQPLFFILTGDVMLGRGVSSYLLRSGPEYPWGNTLPTLSAADLTIINLECVIARAGRPWSRWAKVFHFQADPIAITSLQLAGIDYVTLANNHILDFEEDALTEMLALLDKAKIKHAGAGLNLNEAMQPAVLETSGLKVAVVAFTDNEPGWAATAGTAGTNYIQISLAEESLNVVKDSIIKSRTAGADLVIFSSDKPIIYDAGDFVDDYSVDPVLRNDRGLVFRLLIDEKQIKHLDLLPIFISKCQVNVAIGSDRKAIVERISSLSAEMGTVIDSSAERLWLDCTRFRRQAQAS